MSTELADHLVATWTPEPTHLGVFGDAPLGTPVPSANGHAANGRPLPTPDPAAALTFSGYGWGEERALPYRPGCVAPHQQGRAVTEVLHVPVLGLSLLFDPSAGPGLAEAVNAEIAAARGRLAKVRDRFLTGELVRKLAATQATMEATRAALARAKEDEQRHLRDARQLLCDGLDPAPAEDAYRRAVADQITLANRLEVLAPAAAEARRRAERALREQLEAERVLIEREAVERAGAAAAELARLIGGRLEALHVNDRVAAYVSSNPAVNRDLPGRDVGQTASDEFCTLP
jgi:hypothetical protein